MATGIAACTAADPAVMMNMKTNEYVYTYDMSANPTAAGSVSPTTDLETKRMCRSEAMKSSAKPAFDSMQTGVTQMLIGMSSVHLTPEQHAKIDTIMRDALSHAMTASKAVLSDSQRAELDAVGKQMAFPGP